MKPLRPFPLPLNIGTDICQISRIYGILNSDRGQRFVDRILSPAERAQNSARLQLHANKHQAPSTTSRPPDRDAGGLWKTASFVAGRFAAKEAAIKAHSHRRLTFHDVILERRVQQGERLGSGPPIARIKAAEGEVDETALVSISHDGDYATAVCMSHDPSVMGSGVDKEE